MYFARIDTDNMNSKTPGCVADFKPAFGWLFREYLEGYTHWAFGELDVLFGNMSNGWLGPDELREFDIITFRYVTVIQFTTIHYAPGLELTEP